MATFHNKTTRSCYVSKWRKSSRFSYRDIGSPSPRESLPVVVLRQGITAPSFEEEEFVLGGTRPVFSNVEIRKPNLQTARARTKDVNTMKITCYCYSNRNLLCSFWIGNLKQTSKEDFSFVWDCKIPPRLFSRFVGVSGLAVNHGIQKQMLFRL